MPRRSIADEEIGLIKAMLARGMANKAIQFYFNRQDRAVNSGRITGIKQGGYGCEVPKASDGALSAFISKYSLPELAAPGIVVATEHPSPLDAMDEEKLLSFFARDANGDWSCVVGETDEYECKEGFNLSNFGKPLRTIAGFANNRGGYLFFGVKDRPFGFAVCGLKDSRFVETDQNKFSQKIRSVLQPTPRFRVASLKLDAITVGVIHVEPHSAKPVIASKTDGDVAEGAIYYRYSGETKAIGYPDLRAILDERDQLSRNAILPMVQRLLELGPKDAMVANLAVGQLEGGNRPILIDPQSLEQIKFIREGEFNEVDGAPTLRVVGDAQTVPAEIIAPIRIVRAEVTVDAILRNFIDRNPVEQPLSYFSQVSHEAGWILPIFYYLHLAGQTRQGALNTLKSSKIAKRKAREELVKLLNGKRSLYEKLGESRGVILQRILNSDNLEIKTQHQVKQVCSALTGLNEEHRSIFDSIHSILQMSLAVWEACDGDPDLLGYIRRASARLDELEYGVLVPAE